ncbi:MAG: SAM-dependent methyltransferase [Actinomycetota bacterium]|nr:SAM-dependent methyltransferase [Actinomycetota bacterium]
MVYVDNDPVVVAHGRALLEKTITPTSALLTSSSHARSSMMKSCIATLTSPSRSRCSNSGRCTTTPVSVAAEHHGRIHRCPTLGLLRGDQPLLRPETTPELSELAEGWNRSSCAAQWAVECSVPRRNRGHVTGLGTDRAWSD